MTPPGTDQPQTWQMPATTMPTVQMDERELLVRRSASQMLDRRIVGGPEAAVRALLAVQAQDRTAWRLALRARVAGTTAADINLALTEKRTLLVAWLNRGTLHLVCAEDYPWLRALSAPTVATANARRLAQEGLSPDDVERGVATIERALEADGPLVRSRIRDRLAEQGIRTEGQALVHLLFAVVTRGIAVQGPMIGAEHAFVHAREWLGTAASPFSADDRDRALSELARRYLAGHGPATDADLAKWAGLPLRDARAGLRMIGAELVEMAGGLVDVAARGQAAGSSAAERPSAAEWSTAGRGPAAQGFRQSTQLPPRLLPSWDPSLVGWTSRGPILPRGDEPCVIPPGGGLFRPFATVDGVAAATWGVRRSGDRLEVRIEPFRPLAPEAIEALQAEAHDVARFEGRKLVAMPFA